MEMKNDQTIIVNMDIQMKNEQDLDAVPEDIEMSSGSSGNDIHENYSSGHDSPNSEGDETKKETAMIVEPLGRSKSNESSSKSKSQKELIKTLQELKGCLPPDKRSQGKSSVLTTLKYALRSIKQVKANEEYYHLLMTNETFPCGLDALSHTMKEVENITTEYIMKNSDMFGVAVSLVTGKILFISDQAASILDCKTDIFKNAKFVEFLAPQDVSVFYSSTTPYRLPSWSICNGAESAIPECVEEKSFFCRMSARKQHENEISYHPFRMTPYLIKVQDPENTDDQLCCVLLAEKVHSGYEAPRIPLNKRIFTTTHTPTCLFQDVDERAVPLLGYLPQDLIGTPVLVHLHPSDRPLMIAIHKKILQYGGQPFDYSPVRFCTRNGEYVTLDTSWSSFINPWSRKVSFIIGRHKVRAGPLNEDVFTSHCTEDKILHPSIHEITEQIHRLLLQPVHNSNSSGYGSLGSNGSHGHLMSAASSSDSNGNNNEDNQKTPNPNSFQDVCKNGSVAKIKGDHTVTVSKSKLENLKKSYGEKPSDYCGHAKGVRTGKDAVGTACRRRRKSMAAEELAWEEQPVCSYQQISCLDSVIRYLESCSLPDTLKKKPQPVSSPAVSLDPDLHRDKMNDETPTEESVLSKSHLGPAVLDTPVKSNASPVGGAHLTSLTLPGKPGSVVSFTSQCSYSSTLVHVGDKKTQPELELIEDGPNGSDSLDSQPVASQSSITPKKQETEHFKKLGLTKEVLAVHTQKEEQTFLNKCKEIKNCHIFQYHCNHYFQERSKGHLGERGVYGLRHGSGIDQSWRKNGKNRKSKSKRLKPHDSSDSTTSGTNPPHKFPLLGLNNTAWSPSDTSQASYPAVPFPAVMPAYPLPLFPQTAPTEAPLSGFTESQNSGNGCPLPSSQFSAPLVTPVVALVLPNYVYPQVNDGNPETLCPAQTSFSFQPAFSSQALFTTQPPFTASDIFPPQTLYPTQPFPYKPSADGENNPVIETQYELACSCTPQSPDPEDQASPSLFQSRCSSPLNLLQLEEMPKISDCGAAGTLGNHGAVADGGATSKPRSVDGFSRKVSSPVGSPMETQNSDAFSASSDLLDVLLQEDACSGTGSASSGSGISAAESLQSGSNGCGTSGSRTGSSDTSHTSKYFGSIDSSENGQKTKGNESGGKERYIKYVLQDPVWLLMANADDAVMMTYQIPSRNLDTVLKEDKLKLQQMHKFQPRFTEEQKKELLEVHPWIQKGGLLETVINSDCIYCEQDMKNTQDEEENNEMELNKSKPNGESNLDTLNQSTVEMSNL